MPPARTSRCHCGSTRRCLLLLQPLALRVRVAVISHQRGQVRAGDTRRTNGALSSLAGWLCQLEPGDRACGVAVVAPSRREDLDQAQAVAIFAGVQWSRLAQARRRDSWAAVVDDLDPDAAWDGDHNDGDRA